MKAFIAVSTGITAVVSLLFLTMCGTFLHSYDTSLREQEECKSSYMATYGSSETDAVIACANAQLDK